MENQPLLDPTPEFINFSSSDISPKPSKKKKIFATVGIVVVLIAGFSGYSLFKGFKSLPEIENRVSLFLKSVSENELESAYDLTSSEFKKEVDKNEFHRTFSLTKAQYTEFERLENTGMKIEKLTGRPTVYKFSGTITYTDNEEGDVTADLIKEDGEFKISYIYVNVSLDRYEKFE